MNKILAQNKNVCFNLIIVNTLIFNRTRYSKFKQRRIGLEISKIQLMNFEYFPEHFFGEYGGVEINFRIISYSREIFCSIWLRDEIAITKLKGSPINVEELTKVLINDDKFNEFIKEQLNFIEQFLLTDDAKDFYFNKISLPYGEFEEYVLNRFRVIKQIMEMGNLI